MFTEWSSTKHIILVQTPLFHLWSWQPKTKFVKNIFKNQLLRSYKGDKAETFKKCS